MKIKFTIEKGTESEKEGLFKKKNVEMYTLTAFFSASDNETTTFSHHPLFRNVLFMKYNELDKWTTGLIFKDKKAADREKIISVGDIFDNTNYSFRAYSVQRILELRTLVVEAGQNFTNAADILQRLEGSEEIEFIPTFDANK